MLSTFLIFNNTFQIWKQKGEEYRLTAYSGWAWLSYTRRVSCSKIRKPVPLSDERKAQLDCFINKGDVKSCRDASTDTSQDSKKKDAECQAPHHPTFEHRFLETNLSMSDEKFSRFVQDGLYAACLDYDTTETPGKIEDPIDPDNTQRRSVLTSTAPPFIELGEYHTDLLPSGVTLEPRISKIANLPGICNRGNNKVKCTIVREEGVTCVKNDPILDLHRINKSNSSTSVDSSEDYRIKYLPLEINRELFIERKFSNVSVNTINPEYVDFSTSYNKNDLIPATPIPQQDENLSEIKNSVDEDKAKMEGVEELDQIITKPQSDSMNEITNKVKDEQQSSGIETDQDPNENSNNEISCKKMNIVEKQEIKEEKIIDENTDNKVLIKKESDVPSNWNEINIKKEINSDNEMESTQSSSFKEDLNVKVKSEPIDTVEEEMPFRFRVDVKLIPEDKQIPSDQSESHLCSIDKRVHIRLVVHSSTDGLHSLLMTRIQQEVSETRNALVVRAAVDRMRKQVTDKRFDVQRAALTSYCRHTTGCSSEVAEKAVSTQTHLLSIDPALPEAPVVSRRNTAYDMSVQRLVFGGKIHLSTGVLEEVDHMLKRHQSISRLCTLQKFLSPVKRSAASQRRYHRKMVPWAETGTTGCGPLPPTHCFKRTRRHNNRKLSMFVLRPDCLLKMIRSAGRTEIAHGFNYNCKVRLVSFLIQFVFIAMLFHNIDF